MIASYFIPFSVLALISLNSIAEITPTSPLAGEPKVPLFIKILTFQLITYWQIDFLTF